ncbi:response regulator transcription factor [Cellulophaga baltica]|uniref:DNA-binding response regulator, NarL/FixJ family, contains REC and HTH domains n=1 Tax=Cellulophaga baltica TaxID=76594 RepID=A0A1G7D4P1_9FLAO|nr:response regulator transcription factor [Cellulophaga baltica]SDE46487.1 DNA-binding response regulator, NarL/FixJ family, contains REC and HTH domains [Cellulophaga baltica]
MFKKILIAEDFQDTNNGIVNALSNKLHISEIQEELYCDKAYNRIKVAQTNNDPFELLITDILFKENHVDRKLRSGIELINAIKTIQPSIKIIVNSMEDNPSKIKTLFEKQKIDGYVCKGRHSLDELAEAIYLVYQNNTYVSPIINMVSNNNVFVLDEFDLSILKELADGLSKKEIAIKFKINNITPSSESTIDKRVSKLFDDFGAKNTTQLIAILTRDGLI